MLGTAFNIFKIPDLRNKVLFTIALLIIYRVGFHIPLPGIDQKATVDLKDVTLDFEELGSNETKLTLLKMVRDQKLDPVVVQALIDHQETIDSERRTAQVAARADYNAMLERAMSIGV